MLPKKSILRNWEKILVTAQRGLREMGFLDCVLEIGCFAGGGLRQWSEYLSDLGHPGMVYGVDPFNDDPHYSWKSNFPYQYDGQALRESCLEVAASSAGRVKLIEKKSQVFWEEDADDLFGSNKIGLCIVDGDHDKPVALNDLTQAIQYLSKYGMIIVDDVTESQIRDEVVALASRHGLIVEMVPFIDSEHHIDFHQAILTSK